VTLAILRTSVPHEIAMIEIVSDASRWRVILLWPLTLFG